MINQCADGTHSCSVSELCINEIEEFTCRDKEEIFEDGERFMVTSSIDVAANEEKRIGALSTDFNFKITLDTSKLRKRRSSSKDSSSKDTSSR